MAPEAEAHGNNACLWARFQPSPVKNRWKDMIFKLLTLPAVGCSIHGGFDRRRQGVPLRSHDTESASGMMLVGVGGRREVIPNAREQLLYCRRSAAAGSPPDPTAASKAVSSIPYKGRGRL